MQILIIPDSFKENLTSSKVAEAIRQGILNVLPKVNIKEIPFSDGGEGALSVLQKYSVGKIIKCKTVNALWGRWLFFEYSSRLFFVQK